MKTCEHLSVTAPQQTTTFVICDPITECALKNDLGVRITMVNQANDILKKTFSPNNECHYFNFDMCERCPSHKQ